MDQAQARAQMAYLLRARERCAQPRPLLLAGESPLAEVVLAPGQLLDQVACPTLVLVACEGRRGEATSEDQRSRVVAPHEGVQHLLLHDHRQLVPVGGERLALVGPGAQQREQQAGGRGRIAALEGPGRHEHLRQAAHPGLPAAHAEAQDPQRLLELAAAVQVLAGQEGLSHRHQAGSRGGQGLGSHAPRAGPHGARGAPPVQQLDFSSALRQHPGAEGPRSSARLLGPLGWHLLDPGPARLRRRGGLHASQQDSQAALEHGREPRGGFEGGQVPHLEGLGRAQRRLAHGSAVVAAQRADRFAAARQATHPGGPQRQPEHVGVVVRPGQRRGHGRVGLGAAHECEHAHPRQPIRRDRVVLVKPERRGDRLHGVLRWRRAHEGVRRQPADLGAVVLWPPPADLPALGRRREPVHLVPGGLAEERQEVLAAEAPLLGLLGGQGRDGARVVGPGTRGVGLAQLAVDLPPHLGVEHGTVVGAFLREQATGA